MAAYIYIRNVDGTFSAFEDTRTASAELGRSLRLRWAAAQRARKAAESLPTDPIDSRRQEAKQSK